MIPGTVSIHFISPELLSTDTGWTLLSPAERVRAASFVFPKHAAHWIACRAALRRILGNIIHVPPGEVPLIVTELGKPLLADPFDYLHFSLSHCDDLALLALCVDGPVGVDVEPRQRAAQLPDCEAAFCHPTEIEALPDELAARGGSLLEIWTAKESLLKALGTGFSHAPESFCIYPTPATYDLPLPGIEDQVIHRLDHAALAAYCAAVSAPMATSKIEIHTFETSTSADSSAITAAQSANSDA